MKVSTLIKQLQRQLETHGDLDVFVGHPTETYPVLKPVKRADFIHGSTKVRRGMFFGYKRWPDCVRLIVHTER